MTHSHLFSLFFFLRHFDHSMMSYFIRWCVLFFTVFVFLNAVLTDFLCVIKRKPLVVFVIWSRLWKHACVVTFMFIVCSAYKTVAGVNGPLVILDQVKVLDFCKHQLICLESTGLHWCFWCNVNWLPGAVPQVCWDCPSDSPWWHQEEWTSAGGHRLQSCGSGQGITSSEIDLHVFFSTPHFVIWSVASHYFIFRCLREHLVLMPKKPRVNLQGTFCVHLCPRICWVIIKKRHSEAMWRFLLCVFG